MNRFAPGVRVTGERDRDREDSRDVGDLADASTGSSSLGVGLGGTWKWGAVWNGKSVGDMYRRPDDEPGAAEPSDSSSIGVIGGGGVSGGVGDVKGVEVRGDAASGLVAVYRVPLGLRVRCERLEREDAPAGDPAVLGEGVTSPPAASRMLPRSLP